MKVLHVITGLNQGGAETVLYRLISYISNRPQQTTHHVIVSLSDEGYWGEHFKTLGITVYAINLSTSRLKLPNLIRLAQIMRKEAPDVVQTWMYHADLIGGLTAKLSTSTPIIWNIRNTDLSKKAIKRNTITTARICALLSPYIPYKIISCAQQSIKNHINIGYQKNKFKVIYNGYNSEVFSPNKNKREQLRSLVNVKNNQILFGFVARWDPQKNHKNLLEALSKLDLKTNNIYCLFAGSGLTEENVKLTKLIKGYNLQEHIILLGFNSDISSIMNALDCHVLSSSGEGFPNVVAEAMSCETPCIVTDVGDAAYIVGNTGDIVPPNNPDALAHSMQKMALTISKEGKYIKGKLARQRIIDNFSLQDMAKNYENLWLDAVNQKGK